MSKLTDYSKFDHLDDGSSEEEEQATKQVAKTAPQIPPSNGAVMRKNKENGRYVYEFNGKPIY